MGIAAIMAEVGKQVSYLQKQGSNSAQNYKYARAQDVFLKVNEQLHSRGVSCVQSAAVLEESKDGLGKQGNTHRAIVRISQTYKHDETGETASFEGLGSGSDSQDKAVMKANTAALKYLLTNAFNISWGDDPEASDPETGEATGGREEKPKGKRAPSAAKASKDLLASIAAAKTLEELTTLKVQVQALDPQTPEYQAAKNAYVSRKDTLAQTSIPGA